MSENFASPHKEFQRSPHKQRVTGASTLSRCHSIQVDTYVGRTGFGLMPSWLRGQSYDFVVADGAPTGWAEYISDIGFTEASNVFGVDRYPGFNVPYAGGGIGLCNANTSTAATTTAKFVAWVYTPGVPYDGHWVEKTVSVLEEVELESGRLKRWEYSDDLGNSLGWTISMATGVETYTGTLATLWQDYLAGVSEPTSIYYGKWFSFENPLGFWDGQIDPDIHSSSAGSLTQKSIASSVSSDGTTTRVEIRFDDAFGAIPANSAWKQFSCGGTYSLEHFKIAAETNLNQIDLTNINANQGEIYYTPDFSMAYVGSRLRWDHKYRIVQSTSYGNAYFPSPGGDVSVFPSRKIILDEGSMFSFYDGPTPQHFSIKANNSGGSFNTVGSYEASKCLVDVSADACVESQGVEPPYETSVRYDTGYIGGDLITPKDCYCGVTPKDYHIFDYTDLIYDEGIGYVYLQSHWYETTPGLGGNRCVTQTDEQWASIKPC